MDFFSVISKIIDFINILRENEVPIGLTETMDAINSLKLIDLNKKNIFKQALFASLIKSEKNIEKFNILFEEFFSNLSNIKDDMIEAEKIYLLEKEKLEGISNDRLNQGLEGELNNNQLLFFQDPIENYDNFINLNQNYGRGRSKGKGTYQKTSKVSDDISKLKGEDLLKMSGQLKTLITMLGKKLATKLGLKYKKKKRVLDFRKTIRYNLKHGGKFLELHFKNRHVSKPQLICLIDMSESCEFYYGFMFYLVYLIKQQFSRVKVYEFDSDVIDISEAMKQKNVENAKEAIIKIWSRHDRFKTRHYFKTHSDYHASFVSFLDENVDLNKKTTLLILGDCRDCLGVREVCDKDNCIRGCPEKCLLTRSERDCLYCNCKFSSTYPKSAEILKKMSKRIRRIIVMNPEDESNWNVGDSVAYCYKNVGVEVYPVNDVKSLFHVIYERL
ncbi:MAG: VWA domain-containing protein [Candidatus Lokiarchaeota archaeon]|nr:VWA domain-containing protein [Candidatus Lokiarchaeota archaeon]